MSQITPFVKRMRTQGGTLYAFSSAMEDIGLNINERNNIVKMSHFAMLDIPEITAPDNIQQNRFNLLGIDGALQQFGDGSNTKDGRVLVAESFQNYALNMETILLSEDNYNPALNKTVSERVFWKWMKETGAIRWTKDVSNAGYWIEDIDTDTSVGYNSVVKYIGEISAGSVRTDTFGTYNETYVLVPTSHGQTRVYFKQNYDDNYESGMELGTPSETTGGPDTILGRQDYTKPHPDGLSYQAFYDVIDSSVTTGGSTPWLMQYDASDGSGYQDGWWYSAQGKTFTDDNYYVTDVSTILSSGIYNYKLKYTNGGDTVEFYRSNVDALEVELDIDDLRDIFGDSTLTFNDMAIDESVDDSFEFNAVLLYYSIYNQTEDKVLATNLLGILFLDAAAGNTSGFPDMEIAIPTITKLQSIGTGFGTAYSFRVNIKSDNMIDDTGAVIYDESTSSQTALESWSDVFASLEKSLSIMNANSQTLQYIANQYQIVTTTQNQQADLLSELQYQVNDVVGDVKGTNNTIALFQDGDDPLVDSSIYMDEGKVGIFVQEPSYGFQVDTSISKFMDIMIQNAVYDTSQNVILGYGSPLQLGSENYQRGVRIYDGDSSAVVTVENREVNIKGDSITLDSSAITVNSPEFTIDGSLTVTGATQLSGDIEVAGYVKDGSVESPDFLWDSGFLRLNTTGIEGGLITDNSLGSQFDWNALGELIVVGGGSGASFLNQLLDVSIIGVPNDGSILSYDGNDNLWKPTSIQTTLSGLSDTNLSASNQSLIYYDSGTSKWINTTDLLFDGSALRLGNDIDQISTDSLLGLSNGSGIVEMRFDRTDLQEAFTFGFGCDQTLNEENIYLRWLKSGGAGPTKTYLEIDPNTERFYTRGELRPEILRTDGSVQFTSLGATYFYFDEGSKQLFLGDYNVVGDGLVLDIEGEQNTLDIYSDADGDILSILNGNTTIHNDLTIAGHTQVVDVSVTNNLSVGNIPIGVPDTSQYVLFVREDEGNVLKRTLIWDASYLAFVDNAPNALVTAQSPNSIQGEANLTFDGSILEFNNDTNKTIKMKGDVDSDAPSLIIKGADGAGFATGVPQTGRFAYFYTGGPVPVISPGPFPTGPTTKNYGTFGGYGALPNTNTAQYYGTYGTGWIPPYRPGYTTQYSFTTTTYTGYDGGDLILQAGAGGDGSTGSGLGIVNIGGPGGDLRLSAGPGGTGSAANGVKGDVLIDGTDILLDGDGTSQINGSAIVLNSNIVDVGQQIRHRGDTNTYIEFPSNDRFNIVVDGNNHLYMFNGPSKATGINALRDDVDFYVTSQANPNVYSLRVDVGNSRVGINTDSTPSSTLEVGGSITASGSITEAGRPVISCEEVTLTTSAQTGGSTSEQVAKTWSGITNSEYVVDAPNKKYRLTISGQSSSAGLVNYTFRLRKGTTTGGTLLDTVSISSLASSGKFRLVFEFGAINSTNSHVTWHYLRDTGAADMDGTVTGGISHGSSNGLCLTVQANSASQSFYMKDISLEVLKG